MGREGKGGGEITLALMPPQKIEFGGGDFAAYKAAFLSPEVTSQTKTEAGSRRGWKEKKSTFIRLSRGNL